MADADDLASRRARDALELLKHYSNLRFVMLPIFFTAMGALAVAYDRIIATRPSDATWICWGGVAISVLFICYEYRLSHALAHMASLLPAGLLPRSSHSPWGPVTFFTLLLYLSPIGFFLLRAP